MILGSCPFLLPVAVVSLSVPLFHAEHPEHCETRSLSGCLPFTNQLS